MGVTVKSVQPWTQLNIHLFRIKPKLRILVCRLSSDSVAIEDNELIMCPSRASAKQGHKLHMHSVLVHEPGEGQCCSNRLLAKLSGGCNDHRPSCSPAAQLGSGHLTLLTQTPKQGAVTDTVVLMSSQAGRSHQNQNSGFLHSLPTGTERRRRRLPDVPQ